MLPREDCGASAAGGISTRQRASDRRQRVHVYTSVDTGTEIIPDMLILLRRSTCSRNPTCIPQVIVKCRALRSGLGQGLTEGENQLIEGRMVEQSQRLGAHEQMETLIRDNVNSIDHI